MEEDFWTSVRYDLTTTFAIPWYAYLILAVIFAGAIIAGEWLVTLIMLGVLIIAMFGSALVMASSYQKIAKIGAYIGFEEDGVKYLVPDGEEDEDGKIHVIITTSAPWYELDEIKIFDSFMVLCFVRTSELDQVYVPLASIDNIDHAMENILAYWKQNAQDKPTGKIDRRLLLLIIVIVSTILKLIFKYFNVSSI